MATDEECWNQWNLLSMYFFFLLPLCFSCPWKLLLFHFGRRNILNSLSGKIRPKKKKDLIPIYLLLICWIIPAPPQQKKKRKDKTSKVTMIFNFFKVMPIMDRSAFCACPKQSEWTSCYNDLFVLHALCLLKDKNGTIAAMNTHSVCTSQFSHILQP